MAKSLIKAIGILVMTANINLNTVTIEELYYQNPIIEIPKINLNKTLYPEDKTKNNVNKNIEIISGSKLPNTTNGNLILAAHSGNTKNAYFNNLDKLKYNDTIYAYYRNKKYKYVISDIYDVPKTGYINIKRKLDRTTITLITCKKNTSLQTVYIGYLQ